MRQIKFRIRQKGSMSLNDALYVQISPLGEGITRSELILYPGDVVEQYTGLKDKNGEEIYEGDILTGGSEVFYSTRACKFGIHCKKKSWSGDFNKLYAIDTDKEIVGNIYDKIDR